MCKRERERERERERDLSWCFELVELNEELALQRLRIKERMRDFKRILGCGCINLKFLCVCVRARALNNEGWNDYLLGLEI